jgi:AcrR family transcriptional regulator
LRADARGNRDQILVAAQIVFRERGIDVPMKDIADCAGVGVGTLYRHFPDRTALITGAGLAYLSGLAAMAEAAQAEEAGAWPTLCRLLRECAELRLGALAAALEPTLHDELHRDRQLSAARSRVGKHVVAIATQAQDDGDLRASVDPSDIAHLMTLQIYVLPGEPYANAVQRVMDIVLDGLSAR